MTVKLPKNVVIIRPEAEDGEIKTSEEARDAVFTLVNPRKKEIRRKYEAEPGRLKEDAAEMRFRFRTGCMHNEETDWIIEIQVSKKLLTGKLFIS